jgi:hypothetical protein
LFLFKNILAKVDGITLPPRIVLCLLPKKKLQNYRYVWSYLQRLMKIIAFKLFFSLQINFYFAEINEE